MLANSRVETTGHFKIRVCGLSERRMRYGPSSDHSNPLRISRSSFFFKEPTTDVHIFVLSLQRTPKNDYNTTLAFWLKTHSYNINDKLA
jgi:hypothetical protein